MLGHQGPEHQRILLLARSDHGGEAPGRQSEVEADLVGVSRTHAPTDADRDLVALPESPEPLHERRDRLLASVEERASDLDEPEIGQDPPHPALGGAGHAPDTSDSAASPDEM